MPQEVGRVLAFVATVDQRMPSDEDGFVLRVWARLLAEVPFEHAQRAVEEWYTSDRYSQTRESITPADIVQRTKGWTRTPGGGPAGGLVTNDSGPRQLKPVFDPQRHHDGVDQVFAALAERKAIGRGEEPGTAADIAQGESAARRSYLSRPCPWCGAGVSEACVSPATKKPLTKTPAHDVRMNPKAGAQGNRAGLSRA